MFPAPEALKHFRNILEGKVSIPRPGAVQLMANRPRKGHNPAREEF
jgi:hypothetical protein